MKPLANIFFYIIMALVLISCEKVIPVTLNDADKKYVIEGSITNEPTQCVVSVTQTKSFNENNDFPGIGGAAVTITDNGGTPIALEESSPGKYTSVALNGTPGHVYSLSVVINGHSFTASSTMPSPVHMDSIYVEDQIIFGDSTRTVNVQYQDPAVKGNAYHFIQYKNGEKEKPVFVTNDDNTNGKVVSTQLMTYDNSVDDNKLREGDTVTVIMESIDTPVYGYWFGINAATGQSDSATPTNPVSNITGGALGYFSAHTSQKQMMVVE